MTEYEDKVVKVFVIADWHFKDFYNTTKKKRKRKTTSIYCGRGYFFLV